MLGLALVVCAVLAIAIPTLLFSTAAEGSGNGLLIRFGEQIGDSSGIIIGLLLAVILLALVRFLSPNRRRRR